MDAKGVNEVFITRNVASGGAERLSERAHEDVDAARVDAEVVRNATAMRSEGTDRVGFVDEEVELHGDVSLSSAYSVFHIPCTSS